MGRRSKVRLRLRWWPQTYSDDIQKIPVGGRIFAYIPTVGYVGVGAVAGPAAPADHTSLTVAGEHVNFRSLEVTAPYGKEITDPDPDEDYREWILPVIWERTVDRERAFRVPGLFTNQHTACKLRDQFTIDQVTDFFDAEKAPAR